jgi:hypothetical protein
MSLFWQILEEHTDLLASRGYNENALDSPDTEGWFARQLEMKLSGAIREAIATNEPVHFQLKTAGFFGDDLDVVLFTFSYEYDPGAFELKMATMEARMKDTCIMLELKENKQLPRSQMVYRHLAEGKKMQMARHISSQERNGHKNKLR